MVDDFIESKLSKLGKPFDFVRFAKVDYEEGLIQKLCRVFIGRLNLYANKARFNRIEGRQFETNWVIKFDLQYM